MSNIISVKKDSICIKTFFLFTFLFGIAAHGNMMFNKFSWHDDLQHGFLLSVDKAIGLGRWFRALLGAVMAWLSGGKNLSLPLFHGLISLVFIALSAFLLALVFNIESYMLQILLCGLMVTFPVVTSTFGYMFTAPYYFLALLLSVSAVYAVIELSGFLGFGVGAICISLCLGLYQAYFPVAVSCFVLVLISQIKNNQGESLKILWIRAFKYLGVCICGALLYFAAWKICLRIRNLSASNYQGMSGIGDAGINGLLKGINKTYYRLFMNFEKASENMFPSKLAYLQKTVLILFILWCLYLVVVSLKESLFRGLTTAFLLIILPICFNLIYVMGAVSSESSIHSLMLYGQVILFLGGIQLLSIGIMGQYIARIFLETKHRPLYIVAESSEEYV